MLIDDSDIEAENHRYLLEDEATAATLRLCNLAIEVITALAHITEFDSDDEITVLRLGIRVLNAAAAAGKCALSGYYQPAVAQVRDIIEVAFLLDLFRREPDKISRWRTCSDKERKKEFRPVEIRKRLNDLDSNPDSSREALYAFYSSHGTHAHPATVQLISPDMMTMIGPFPDRTIITHIVNDIAHATCTATGYFSKCFDFQRIQSSKKLEVSQIRLNFAIAWTSWLARNNDRGSNKLG